MSSIQYGVIRTFCPLGHILELEVLGCFSFKNQTRKIDKIDKHFELYQVYMPKCSNISKYIYIYI